MLDHRVRFGEIHPDEEQGHDTVGDDEIIIELCGVFAPIFAEILEEALGVQCILVHDKGF